MVVKWERAAQNDYKSPNITNSLGARGGAVGWDTVLHAGFTNSISDGAALWSLGRLSPGTTGTNFSQRNEYHEYFLGVKVAGA
jgi:hypothetical protein